MHFLVFDFVMSLPDKFSGGSMTYTDAFSRKTVVVTRLIVAFIRCWVLGSRKCRKTNVRVKHFNNQTTCVFGSTDIVDFSDGTCAKAVAGNDWRTTRERENEIGTNRSYLC